MDIVEQPPKYKLRHYRQKSTSEFEEIDVHGQTKAEVQELYQLARRKKK